MAKIKNTTIQSTSTPAAGLRLSAYYKANGIGFVEDMFNSKTWIDKSKKYGYTRKCRICKKSIGREEHFLKLDQHDHGLRIQVQMKSHYAVVHKPLRITICQTCVDDWSKQLHKLNDIQRNSTLRY